VLQGQTTDRAPAAITLDTNQLTLMRVSSRRWMPHIIMQVSRRDNPLSVTTADGQSARARAASGADLGPATIRTWRADLDVRPPICRLAGATARPGRLCRRLDAMVSGAPAAAAVCIRVEPRASGRIKFTRHRATFGRR
jgi:hypothetical protein